MSKVVANSKTEALLDAFHEESSLGKAYDARLLGRLRPFVMPYRKQLLLSLGLGVVTAGLALTRPWIMRETIDHGVMDGDQNVLLRGGLLFGLVIVTEQVLLFVQTITMMVAGARSMGDLRQHVFAFLHDLRLRYFDEQPVGRLVTRVTNDVDAIHELFASGALNAVIDCIRLVGIVVLMLSFDPRLSLIGFASAPIVVLLAIFVRRRSREAFRAIRAKTARMNATMNEQVSGMMVVQAFTRQRAAASEFDAINSSYRDANMRSIKYEAMQDAAIEMVASVCLASIVISLGYQPASFGTVVAFNAYLIMFFEPISALAQRYTVLQSAMAGAERVFGLLDIKEPDAPKIPEAQGAPVQAGASGSLAFEDVTFSYKAGSQVLHGVSFRAQPGKRIALVGPTGAGKSTVASLALRLYEPDAGVVRVDGRDVRTLSRHELRRKFAVVPQDVFLFPGTVLSNIAIGDEVPDRRRVEQALRRIDALDMFLRRPQGLDARVEERGENFSAGERQLIAFARALYRDAPILILDEATASVDSDTEARLQAALEILMRGRTALVIAHRLSTVRAADAVLVFRLGRLIEQGTHEELLAQGGLYARLHALQFARGPTPEQAAEHVSVQR